MSVRANIFPNTLKTKVESPNGNSSVTPFFDKQYDRKASISTFSKKSSQNNVNDAQQKHDNGYLIYAMHHFDIYVREACRVLFSEIITSYLTQRKKILPPFLRSLFHFSCFIRNVHKSMVQIFLWLNPVAIFTNQVDQFVNRFCSGNVFPNDLPTFV